MSDPTDEAAGESPSTFRLIYRSHSLIGTDDRRTELAEIFTTARRKNKRLDVTGALVITDESFAQALEGEEGVVRALYATISQDPRHDHLAVVEERTVEGRAFGRWAMAKVATDGGSDIRLMSNASKGVIVAASSTDPGVTPEQEKILAFMRESIALDPA